MHAQGMRDIGAHPAQSGQLPPIKSASCAGEQACNLQLPTAEADASCSGGAQCCTRSCAASMGVPLLEARASPLPAPHALMALV